MIRRASIEGGRAALVKFGLAQPSLSSVGIQAPTKAPGLPSPGQAPSRLGDPLPAVPDAPGVRAAKAAAAVGMGFSTPRHEGPGGVPGEPADEGRRQRSVVDRAFQRNEDDYATSSMPLPGAMVSP